MISPSLSKGTSGDTVKTLQRFLISQGLLGKQYETGYFGDLTDKALKQYQSMQGMTVDGVVGPQTNSMIKNHDTTQSMFNDPRFSPGTPGGDLLKQYKDTGNTQMLNYLSTQYANGRLASPGQIKNAYDNAVASTSGYYNEQKSLGKSTLSNYLAGTEGQYNAQSNELNNQFDKNYRDFLNNEGDKGTWSSSARTLRANNLQNTFNNSQQNLYSGTAQGIQSNLIKNAYEYGSDVTPTVNLNKTQGTLGSSTPNLSSSSSSISNPNDFIGRVNPEQSQAVIDKTQGNLEAQNYNPNKGLSI